MGAACRHWLVGVPERVICITPSGGGVRVARREVFIALADEIDTVDEPGSDNILHDCFPSNSNEWFLRARVHCGKLVPAQATQPFLAGRTDGLPRLCVA